MSLAGLQERLGVLRAAECSWILAGLILLIQSWVTIAGGHNAVSAVYETLGLSREGLLSGKVWQIGTYGLLHGGFAHAALNAVCVVLVGSWVEHVMGGRMVLKAMAAGILGGAAAHLALSPAADGSPILVGASGGCMGLLLLLTTLSPDARMWPVPLSARNLGVGLLSAELVLALINPGLGLPGLWKVGRFLSGHGFSGWFAIGHACHFGGGLAGLFLARWFLRPRVTAESLRRDRERRERRRQDSL